MQVKLIGMSQNVNFDDMEVLNVVQLGLPNGKIVQVVVDEATAQEIVNCRANGDVDQGVAPPPQTVQPTVDEMPMVRQKAVAASYTPVAVQNEDGDTVFGGDGATPDMDLSAIQQNLDTARDLVGQSVGSIDDVDSMSESQLRAAVKALKEGISELPKPKFASGGAQYTGTPKWNNGRKPVVQKDGYGYPIIKGQGYVDPGEVVGSNSDEDEEAGQI